MEWNRGVRPNQPAGQPVAHPTGMPTNPVAKPGRSSNKSSKIAGAALILGVVILVIAALFFAVFAKKGGEFGAVDSKRMQAVFLNGGQVYFGHITDLNDKYLRMGDIYYLRVNQQVQPNQTGANATQSTGANDISLVKLGCELHGPEDKMVINQSQVIFWENLKDDGQVAKAVAEYKKNNPTGQKCDQGTNNTTGATDNTGTTGTTNTGTTGTTSTGTTGTTNKSTTTTTR